MKNTRIQDNSLFTLENENYPSSIFPKKRTELNRDVRLFGKVIVEGSIYARDLFLETKQVGIEKSVFVDKSIEINGLSKAEDIAWFKSTVAAKENILAIEAEKGRVRFSNHVFTETVRLKNTIIYGNLYCQEAFLKNCVVIGGVYAKKKAEIENSIIGTANCNDLVFKQNNGLMDNFAVARSIKVSTGQLFSTALIEFNGKAQQTFFGIAKDEIITTVSDDSGEEKMIISPISRIFDLKKYARCMKENNRKIIELTYQSDWKNDETNKKCLEIEIPLFDLIEKNFNHQFEIPISSFTNIDGYRINGQHGQSAIGRDDRMDSARDYAENHDEFGKVKAETVFVSQEGNVSPEVKDYLDEGRSSISARESSDSKKSSDQEKEQIDAAEEPKKFTSESNDMPVKDSIVTKENEKIEDIADGLSGDTPYEDKGPTLLSKMDSVNRNETTGNSDIVETNITKESPIFCTRCGHEIKNKNLKFCTNCGSELGH